MRMLDALRAGEKGVQRGLSERVNFEVALLRATDHSRTRPIDTVIRELSKNHKSQASDSKKK